MNMYIILELLSVGISKYPACLIRPFDTELQNLSWWVDCAWEGKIFSPPHQWKRNPGGANFLCRSRPTCSKPFDRTKFGVITRLVREISLVTSRPMQDFVAHIFSLWLIGWTNFNSGHTDAKYCPTRLQPSLWRSVPRSCGRCGSDF